MTAEPPQSPVTEAVRSPEVRWIFPGQLEAAVAGWFGRFPAAVESREDTYLLDPRLRGLSVKVRGGGALEVKAYRGSPGILEVAGRARGPLQSWQKWSFPFSPPRQDSGNPAGWRPVRKRRRISRFSLASGPVVAPAPGPGPGAAVRRGTHRGPHPPRTGGPWDSRRPAPPACSAAHSRPPPRWCSPRPCPVKWNPARMTPGPTRSGWASSRAPTGTPAPEDSPPGRLAAVLPAPPGVGPTGTPEATLPPPITSTLPGWRCECMAEAKYGRPAGRAGDAHVTGESGRPRHS
jgi:hypothetical protein